MSGKKVVGGFHFKAKQGGGFFAALLYAGFVGDAGLDICDGKLDGDVYVEGLDEVEESGWNAVFGEDKEESFTIKGVDGFYLVEKRCPSLEAVLLAALKALLQDESSVGSALLFAETVLWLVTDVVKDGLKPFRYHGINELDCGIEQHDTAPVFE